MLDYLGEEAWAERIEGAVVSVLRDGEHLTPDLGGSSSTDELAEAVVEALEP